MQIIVCVFQCIGVPNFSKHTPNEHRKLELFCSILWGLSISCLFIYNIFFASDAYNGVSGQVIVAIFYNTRIMALLVIVLVQKHRKSLQRIEDRVWIELEKIDVMFLEYLRYKSGSIVKRNQIIAYICWLSLSLYSAMQVVFGYRLMQFMFNPAANIAVWNGAALAVINALHLLKIKLVLTLLNTRVELLRNAMQSVIIMQHRNGERRSSLGTCRIYSKDIIETHLKASKTIYESIFQASKLMNDLFGGTLLFIVFYYFLEIIEYSYWIFYTTIHDFATITWDIIFRLLPPIIILLELACIASKIKQNVGSFLFLIMIFHRTLSRQVISTLKLAE